jgi:hypothetical protein
MMVAALAVFVVFALPLAAGAADMTNGITNPADGSTVSGTVDVTGYASAPGFWKWQLDILPGGAEDAASFLAVGETEGEFSYSLDTTAYPNGEHALRLRIVTTDGNYQEFVNKFTISNAAAAAAAAPTEAMTAEAAATPAAAPTAAATPAPAEANGITNPADGSTVSGSVDVMGYASAPEFSKWQLDILPGGAEDAASFLALGEESGVFTHTLDTTAYPNGDYALRLRVVTTDSNYQEFVNNFTIANAAAAPAATTTTAETMTPEAAATPAAAPSAAATPAPAEANGITSPKAGATVSGSVDVMGYASAPDFWKWQLDLLPVGHEDLASFLAVGETEGEFTYTLDTTSYPNGDYALRLRIVTTDGNYQEFVNTFVIAN